MLLAAADQSGALADILGTRLAPVPGKIAVPVAVRPGVGALAVDPAALVRQRYRALSPLLRAHNHRLGIALPDPDELLGLPLAEELLAWNDIAGHAASGQWDVVVIDCAPTAELLRMLQAPHLFLTFLEQLWPARQRANSTDARALVLAAAVEEVANVAVRVRDLLSSHAQTRAQLVTLAEAAGVGEAARLRSAAALFGIRVDSVIINRLHAAPAQPDEWHSWRIAAQDRAIARLGEALPDLNLCYLPESWTEPVGLEGLEPLTRDFASVVLPRIRRTIETDAADGPWRTWNEPGSPAVHAVRMYLPVADPASLRLGRAEGDLIVGADGLRRRIPLPAHLSQAAVLDAELDSHYLIVRLQTAERGAG